MEYSKTIKPAPDLCVGEQKPKPITPIERWNRIFAVAFCGLVFLNILLPDAFVISRTSEEALALNEAPFAIARLLFNGLFVILPIAAFFDSGLFKKLSVYYAIPVLVLNAAFMGKYISYFTDPLGRGLYTIRFVGDGIKSLLMNETFRACWFALILAIGLGACLSVLFASPEKLRWRLSDIPAFFLSLIGIIACTIPIYVPQYIVGYTDLLFDSYTPIHFAWIAFTILLTVLLHFIFRNRSAQDKYVLCIALALALMIEYNSMFGAIAEINFMRLPLQLCNLGSYLILLALITKKRMLINFTIVINVVGAILAIALPDVDGQGIGYLWNMHFVMEHTNVLVTPILCLSLGVFSRMNRTTVRDFIICFAVYFVAMLAIGTLLNGIAERLADDYYAVNYLFMFDGEKAGNLVGALGKLFEIELRFGHFCLYPVAQLTIFVLFSAICGLFYGIVRLIYRVRDSAKGRRLDSPKEQSKA